MITLRDYQENISDKAAEKLHNNGLAYLSMEVRTGKTLTALATAAKYGAKSVLFITKIKAIPSIRADYDLLSPEYKLEIINYESVHKCTGEYDLIVCDEAHSLGALNHHSEQKPSKRLQTANQCFICRGHQLPKAIRSCTINFGCALFLHSQSGRIFIRGQNHSCSSKRNL